LQARVQEQEDIVLGEIDKEPEEIFVEVKKES